MTEQKMQIKPYPLGAHCEEGGIRFSFVSEKENCGVLIYQKESGKKIGKIPFEASLSVGNIHCAYTDKYQVDEISYQFYEEDKIVPDRRAAAFSQTVKYGRERSEKELKAVFETGEFDWQNDRFPRIPYKDCIAYLLHVRGFTKHSSAKVEHGGTFLGMVEKLPYLKEIGITTVELQPAYEFAEMPTREERSSLLPYPVEDKDMEQLAPAKLNYWGYKRGYYYTPKAAYAVDNPCVEFKQMVREFHKNGMEIVMQFYFPKEVTAMEIPEILRYWMMEYHVDGFRLMGECIPIELLTEDPALAGSKLWFDHSAGEGQALSAAAEYRDDYLYTMRRFLKGDEGMISPVLYQMRHIPASGGRIHYLSNYNGFTLMDMVSFDRKHNEENGEDNRDGNDYNCSWNCGEEGITRKRKIFQLRKQQIQNAMCMLLFSQSTPLIFMGDEFGNSQKGNNNPYCQDNAVTWLVWSNQDKNRDLLSFWKNLVEIRKNHPILHPERELKIMDSIACGYPDLSYHGRNAWKPETENYSRYIGMMYCGKYAKKADGKEDDFFYLAMNMHWESHESGLPKLPKEMKWKAVLSTAKQKESGWVAPRSIVLFQSVAQNAE